MNCKSVVKIAGIFALLSVVNLPVVASAKDITSLQAYRIGYSDGYEKGYVRGYEKAVSDFKKIFREKLEQYKAIETGKFLLKDWHISYPEVYLTQGGHLVIGGCQILKPIDNLPSYVQIPVINSGNAFLSNQGSSSYGDFGFVPSGSGPEIYHTSKPHRYYSTYVDPKFASNLSGTNTIYFLDTNNNMYKVYFNSKKDMDSFCLTHKGACQ
ncbi:MAG TPA: hypothetical protein ENO30_03775 [Thermodesulfobium narugense]|nr:hypothetical protein [Thermodesulfobium narugense]